jgi:hypothetical protein
VLTFWPYVWQLDPGHTYDEHLVLALKTGCDTTAPRLGPGLGGGRACNDVRQSRRATAAQSSPAPTTFSPKRLCPLFFISVILGSCHYCKGDSISSPSSSQSSGYWWMCIDLFLSAASVGWFPFLGLSSTSGVREGEVVGDKEEQRCTPSCTCINRVSGLQILLCVVAGLLAC